MMKNNDYGMRGTEALNDDRSTGISGKHAFSVGLHALAAIKLPKIGLICQTNDCTPDVRRITTQLGESG
jgi:hypothetical protein